MKAIEKCCQTVKRNDGLDLVAGICHLSGVSQPLRSLIHFVSLGVDVGFQRL